MTRLQWSDASGAVTHPEIRFSMALDRAAAFTRYAKALARCAKLVRQFLTRPRPICDKRKGKQHQSKGEAHAGH